MSEQIYLKSSASRATSHRSMMS